MGQVISNVIRNICGEVEEEERPSEKNLLISPPWSYLCSDSVTSGALQKPLLTSTPSYGSCSYSRTSETLPLNLPTSPLCSDSCSDSRTSGAILQENLLISPPSSDISSNSSTSGALQQNLLLFPPSLDSRTDSSTNAALHLFMVDDSNSKLVEDKRQVSPSLLDLNRIELREEEEEKEEEEAEEREAEKLSRGVVTKERWMRQVVEDKWQVSPPLLDLNIIEPREEEKKKKMKKRRKKKKEEEEKLSRGLVIKEIWIKHYSSCHIILLVGEGDFSFSACLAKAFGSATNMVATSLNSRADTRN